MVREMSIQHLTAIAARRVASRDKKETVFPIHPPYVPPKSGEYTTPYGKVKLSAWLDKEKGKWFVRVKFDTELENPVLSSEGANLLKSIKK